MYSNIIPKANSRPTLVYQGERGAYSEIAAISYLKRLGWQAKLSNVPTFSKVFDKVSEGKAEYGIVPLENSIESSVNDTHRLLLRNGLSIVGEVYVDVHHCLMARNGVSMEEVRVVYSHPQALGQCSSFIDRHGFKTAPMYNTAGSAKIVSEEKLTYAAAIASERAAELYGLKILQRDIEDDVSNTTRFIILGAADIIAMPTRNDKTSLIVSLPHKPHALASALVSLGGINITRIESMPAPGKPWEYLFYIDIEGHNHDNRIGDALDDLAERSSWVKILGSYPMAEQYAKTFDKGD
ncbi:MAG: prephenate dehydratase [Candidatus Micrarchaeota archaeon]|nr:prephenate dehydratase [Candidatus Micrarchaeota archaeon]MDE1847707.1 prephenate dehydratase [Candidatus Micrarchaeota archaeon]MDE1864136.1 prephenate dehydratase [Candidatus Micrarchaeota archaeon]